MDAGYFALAIIEGVMPRCLSMLLDNRRVGLGYHLKTQHMVPIHYSHSWGGGGNNGSL